MNYDMLALLQVTDFRHFLLPQQLQLEHILNLNNEKIPTYNNFITSDGNNNFYNIPANISTNFDLENKFSLNLSSIVERNIIIEKKKIFFFTSFSFFDCYFSRYHEIIPCRGKIYMKKSKVHA